jgi:hypothetical protein
MKPTQIGNRIVVIGSHPPAAANRVARREPADPPAKCRRTVVIKDGELVGRWARH